MGGIMDMFNGKPKNNEGLEMWERVSKTNWLSKKAAEIANTNPNVIVHLEKAVKKFNADYKTNLSWENLAAMIGFYLAESSGKLSDSGQTDEEIRQSNKKLEILKKSIGDDFEMYIKPYFS